MTFWVDVICVCFLAFWLVVCCCVVCWLIWLFVAGLFLVVLLFCFVDCWLFLFRLWMFSILDLFVLLLCLYVAIHEILVICIGVNSSELSLSLCFELLLDMSLFICGFDWFDWLPLFEVVLQAVVTILDVCNVDL